MSDTLKHRGPDDSGCWVDEASGVALAHRRLSIIDLSPAGHQPMVSSCGRYIVTFNGEIYNFQALRTELAAQGQRFRGDSDTEVILAAVVQWGVEAALKRFNGMFAFGLWDQGERVLHIARDRAGEKPLYFATAGSTFLFASELRALKKFPGFSPCIDRKSLDRYVRCGYVPGPQTIYENVGKLPPGSLLTVSGLALSEPTQFWSPEECARAAAGDGLTGSADEIVEQLDALLRNAVKTRMIADVSLGAFLSGGIDSSIIVAMMQTQSSKAIKTFTVGFHDPAYNEAPQATLVAKHLGTEHSELYLGPRQALDTIPILPSLYDEPFADSSQIPTFLVSRFARQSVTVSLSGDGGDELFGGYRSYQICQSAWRNAERIPKAWLGRISSWLEDGSSGRHTWSPADLLDSTKWTRRKGAIADKLERISLALRAKDPESMHQCIVSQGHAPLGLVLGTDEHILAPLGDENPSPFSNLIQRLMYMDFRRYLPDDILVKVDRASMGVSLESRAPFLDHLIVEFAWRVPPDMLVRNRRTKWVLRQVLRRYLPEHLIDRKKKGFAVPICDWLRGPLRSWAEDTFDISRLRREGYLDASSVASIWQDHLSGRRDRSRLIWNLLMFEAWLTQHS